MLTSLFLSHIESSSIVKLFDTPATSLDDILNREDILPYLRQFADPTRIPRSIMRYVAAHVSQLLIAAQQKYLAAHAENGDAKVKAIRATKLSLGPTDLNGEASASGGAVGSAAAAVEAKVHADGAPAAVAVENAATAALKSNAEIDDEVQRSLLADRSPACVHARSVNSTELLFFYISSPEFGHEAIERIVPVTTAALAHPGALDPFISLSVQRLLLAAFDNDFLKTTETIAQTLDEEIVLGTIRNLSQSSVVAETLIALFGSALSASTMMDPTTHTEQFTSAWISCHFVELLCAQLPLVITERSNYNYFYFLHELLKRGFSHTAGPIVDAMLRPELFMPMLETIITTCEVDAQGSIPTKTDTNSSLSPDAMAVMASVISTMRKSLILPDTRNMYSTTTDYIAPLRAVRQQKERLVALLQHANVSGAAIITNDTVGLTRTSVCEMFVEMALYQLSSTDTILVESGFLRAFLRLCETYAANNVLARLLQVLVTNIFSRPLLQSETVRDAMSRDILLRHVISTEEAFVTSRGGNSSSSCSPTEAGAVLSSLLHFATAEPLRFTAVASFSTALLNMLHTSVYFNVDTSAPAGSGNSSSDPLANVLDCVRDSATVKERTDAMISPITGELFGAKGSARTPAVRHRPVVNLAGERLSGKLGIFSLSDNDVGSPNARGPVASLALSSTLAGGGDDGRIAAANVGDADADTAVIAEAISIDMDAISEEVLVLRAAGSPQLQAYPDFRSMQLSFTGAVVAELRDMDPAGDSEHSPSGSEEIPAAHADPVAADVSEKVGGAVQNGSHRTSGSSAGVPNAGPGVQGSEPADVSTGMNASIAEVVSAGST